MRWYNYSVFASLHYYIQQTIDKLTYFCDFLGRLFNDIIILYYTQTIVSFIHQWFVTLDGSDSIEIMPRVHTNTYLKINKTSLDAFCFTPVMVNIIVFRQTLICKITAKLLIIWLEIDVYRCMCFDIANVKTDVYIFCLNFSILCSNCIRWNSTNILQCIDRHTDSIQYWCKDSLNNYSIQYWCKDSFNPLILYQKLIELNKIVFDQIFRQSVRESIE